MLRVDPSWNLPRSCVGVVLVTQLAAERGLDLATCLRGTGISPTDLDDPDAEITGIQELKLVQNVVAELGDIPGRGFASAARFHPLMHGVWGYAVTTAATLRDALRIVARYVELGYSFARVSLEAGPATVSGVLVLDYAQVPADVRAFLIERDLSGLLNAANSMSVRPSVEVAESMLTRLQPLADRPLRPSGDVLHRITWRFDDLDQPLAQANPHSAATFERLCADLLQRRRARVGVAGEVRVALLHAGIATADQADIAATVYMSVRTMRRRLAAEGTSFRELVAETAGLMAQELLAAGVPAEAVALRLGYANGPSFTRAFKQWTGTPPGQYARGRLTAPTVRNATRS
jgi:AraC-like DNA-binding protein